MKVLVATKQTQGTRDNDFSHTILGELVTFGSECDHEDVDGSCGCKRALCGVNSHKATTTFRVAERNMNIDDLATAIKASLVNGGWVEEDDQEADEWAMQDAESLTKITEHFNVGDVIERRGNKYVRRTSIRSGVLQVVSDTVRMEQ